MSSIDNLLNDSLDNIDDLPSTEAWPVGAHLAKVTLKVNNKNKDKPSIIADLELISTEEKANEDDKDASPGDKYGLFYHLKKSDGTRNDFALQQLKAQFGTAMVNAGLITSAATTQELIDSMKDGVEMLLTTGRRKYNDEWQMTVKSAVVAS